MPPAGAEGLVVGIARCLEAVGILVLVLVPIRADVPHDHLLALLDRLAGELGIAGRGAAEVGEGGEHAERLLDRARDQLGVLEQQPALVRVLDQSPHRARVGRLRRVVAGGDEQEEAHHDLVIGELSRRRSPRGRGRWSGRRSGFCRRASIISVQRRKISGKTSAVIRSISSGLKACRSAPRVVFMSSAQTLSSVSSMPMKLPITRRPRAARRRRPDRSGHGRRPSRGLAW